MQFLFRTATRMPEKTDSPRSNPDFIYVDFAIKLSYKEALPHSSAVNLKKTATDSLSLLVIGLVVQ